MEKDESILVILEEQRNTELRLAKTLEESPVKSVAQCIVKSLALDSLKHALMYQTLIDLEKGAGFVGDQEKRSLIEIMKKHAAEEVAVLEKLNSLMKEISDPRIRSVINHIIADEIRHHKVLEDFVEALYLKEEEYDIVAYEWVKSL